MADIVMVGYTCPQCGRKVEVLSSVNHPATVPESVTSTCQCGYVRNITLLQLQTLEVWRASA